MGKRYRKMQRKANGKIREIKDEQVILEIPLPVADVLSGIPEAVEGLSQEVGLMLVGAVIKSKCVTIAGQKDIKNPMRTANWWGSQLGPIYYDGQKVLIDRPRLRSKDNLEVELNTYRAFQSPKRMRQSVARQDNIRPVFVSPGRRIDLKNSIEIILNCITKYRIPEPLRMADFISKKVKQRFLY